MLYSTTTTTSTSAILLLSLLTLTTAKPITSSSSPALAGPPGRHAPPYLASKLGGHKRALKRWWTAKNEDEVVKRDDEPYYGAAYGLTPPRSTIPTTPSPALLPRAGIPSSMPSGWTYSGCVEESAGARLLQGFGFSSHQSSASVCASVCGVMGFELSATEYGNECYCGNDLIGSGGTQMSDGDCSMPCAGNPSEMCGNAWRLSLYRFNGTTTGESGSSSSSSSVASSASSTMTGSVGLNATATATGTATGTLSAALPANTTTTTTAPTTPSVPTTGELEWMSIGCAIDLYVDARVIPGIHFYGQKDLTVDKCITMCEDAGYTFAGVEWGEECYCGNSTLASIQYVDDKECSMPCAGDSSETCGENFRMEIFQLTTAEECEGEGEGGAVSTTTKAALPTGNLLVTGGSTSGAASAIATPSSFVTSIKSSSSAKPATTSVVVVPTTTTKAAAVPTTTKAAAAATTTTSSGPKPTGLVERVSTNIPSSNRAHEVYAHHMVGNTYPYGKADWAKDIANAKAAGIDGFALNMGSDWWQAARVADAYAAAVEAGGFTMFLSLDMTAMGCGSVTDAATLVALVTTFGRSSAQTKHNGKVLVSTFSGENCQFGQGSTSDGWNIMFKQPLKMVGTDIFFVPSVFSDPSTFASASWMDGELNWNSGWPMSASALDTSSDKTYAAALGSKEYMPAISPYFFTHFPTWGWNKNWIYRSDDFLYARRWEQVIAMRDTVKFTEILTWNDYGESSYISPTVGALPAGSEVWVDGFPHDALLDVTQYYATAFKTGAYPAVTQDKVIWWARPHPKAATATSDYIGRPSRWDETEDNVYALVFSTGDGVVTMTSGSNKETYAVTAGLNKIKLGMAVGSVTVKLTRNGSNVFSCDSAGEFSYTNSPSAYNYNYMVKKCS